MNVYQRGFWLLVELSPYEHLCQISTDSQEGWQVESLEQFKVYTEKP
jgi:hypothetical protein